MFRILAAAALLWCLAGQSFSQPLPTPKPQPLEIYGRLPGVDDVEISPDGTRLALILTDGARRILVVRNIADGQVVWSAEAGLNKVRDLSWAGPDDLLLTTSRTAYTADLVGPDREYFFAFDANITKKSVHQLLEGKGQSTNFVLSIPITRRQNGLSQIFVQGVYFENNNGRNAVYQIDPAKSFTKRLPGSNENTDDWAISADGEAFAQSLYDQKTGEWSLHIKTASGWIVADRAISPTGSYGILGLGRSGRTALVQRESDDHAPRLIEYAEGSMVDIPVEPGFEGVIRDPATGLYLGQVSRVGDVRRYSFLDPKLQGIWNGLIKAYAGSQISIASWSDDRQRWVIKVDTPDEGPAFALVDLKTRQSSWLDNVYPNLTADGVSEVRAITYPAADGLQINGYLTLPKGRDPRNLPLIVLPHGGPEGRDTLGFDWWSQALASRGYAVLRPNFRGSEGYGWPFLSAGFGQWGKKMQTDLSDGVRFLAKQGLIDPKRVCIVGASYGGYAALAGATLDTGVYRCAVSVAGPADLQRMLLEGRDDARTWNNSRLRFWLRFMGADGANDRDLSAISPAKHADKITIPVMLIHGKNDTVVPYLQSQIMAAAIETAGKKVEFVTLPGEDHWLSQGATRLQMLTSTVDFLERNNPPR